MGVGKVPGTGRDRTGQDRTERNGSWLCWRQQSATPQSKLAQPQQWHRGAEAVPSHTDDSSGQDRGHAHRHSRAPAVGLPQGATDFCRAQQ